MSPQGPLATHWKTLEATASVGSSGVSTPARAMQGSPQVKTARFDPSKHFSSKAHSIKAVHFGFCWHALDEVWQPGPGSSGAFMQARQAA